MRAYQPRESITRTRVRVASLRPGVRVAAAAAAAADGVSATPCSVRLQGPLAYFLLPQLYSFIDSSAASTQEMLDNGC